jgi:hypothetical protein
MSQKIFTLTFDTSVKIDAFDSITRHLANSEMFQRVKAATRLKDAHNTGQVQVFYNGGEKTKETKEPNTFVQVRGPWFLGMEGFSEAGVSTILMSRDFVSLVESVLGVPNASTRNGLHNLRDHALLIEHIHSERDIFVTADKRYTRHAIEFLQHKVVIKTAEETVSFLESKAIL